MRSLLKAVADAATDTPDDAWAYIPNARADGTFSWTPMTWSQLESAISIMAGWVESQLGQPGQDCTVAYMGSNDIRYPITMLACMKVGYRVLLPSPRNSMAGQAFLFDSVQCHKVLYSPELRIQVDQVVASHPTIVTKIEIPEMSDLQNGTLLRHWQVNGKPKDLCEEDTVIILHSSGTTGLPKPIPFNIGALAVVDTIKEMEAPPGRCNTHDALYTATTMISMLPFFHIMGVATILRAIYHRGPLAFLPTGTPITADLMADAIHEVRPSAIACAPSILEAMSGTGHGREALAKVGHVFYGGAPLAQESGNRISEVTVLINAIGSTEILNVPSYIPQDPKDWEYFEWNPAFGVAMDDRQDGYFELIIKQKYSRKHQLLFHNFPHLSEWQTKDLFEKHPRKHGLWRYIGRSDDTLVLSNGEKVAPVLFEKAIEGHELVKGALLAGSQRFQTCLIIEPHSFEAVEDDLIDRLWPSIEAANALLPSHAKVWRSMTVISVPNKPFSRAPKGSIKRQATCKLYAEEIRTLYVTAMPLSVASTNISTSAAYTAKNTKAEIRKAVFSILQSTLADDEDFFHNGMDSLKALQLHQLILSSIPSQNTEGLFSPVIALPLISIYKNPTINRLADYVVGVVSGGGLDANSAVGTASREENMSKMIYEHFKLLPQLPNYDVPKLETSHVVVLTGSTGSLGTYLLGRLLSQPDVSRVYCLNRSADAQIRQKLAFQDRGLDVSNFDNKVVFLAVDLTKTHFGLAPSQYESLKEESTLLVHNAWPVNFNNDLEYFADSIYGARRLIELAIIAHHRPRFVFVSSIASVGNFASVRPNESKIAETMDEDNSLPLAQGYGESKHVVSSIMARAAKESGLGGTIVRVGQLSGPDEGAAARWNKTEWLPVMVLTSKHLGKIPSSLGSHDALDWVPVNKAAEILLELALPATESYPFESTCDSGLKCYNLVNPRVADWGDMVNIIQRYYGERGQPVEAVPFDTWIKELENMKISDSVVTRYPALKLLAFYREMNVSPRGTKIQFDTHLGQEQSSTLAELKAVDGKLMDSWLQGWDCED
ncbi:hypothetical protein G7046_g1833 [Stylonectria norvegica]|nr:hypothetical protein G7046_g1833 [Stylonectria norvegica]